MVTFPSPQHEAKGDLSPIFTELLEAKLTKRALHPHDWVRDYFLCE